jgi:hypothetical protein
MLGNRVSLDDGALEMLGKDVPFPVGKLVGVSVVIFPGISKRLVQYKSLNTTPSSILR